MGTTTTLALPNAGRAAPALRGAIAELYARERRLALYGAILLALLLPLAIAWGLDERTLRGANVWIKPIKFALSIAALAFTTAWLIGHLPPARRRGRAIDAIVWLVIGAGSFELGYIALQAGLGQASHYNSSDVVHIVMYALMGIGALLLTASQPLLAWQLYRHPDRARPAALREAVLIGLVLTFVFGAGIGMVLANRQPPSGAGVATLPLVGWVLGGGDLRPAHFVGIHAEQLLPVVGWLAVRFGLPRPRAMVWGASVLVALGFGALVVWGLAARA